MWESRVYSCGSVQGLVVRCEHNGEHDCLQRREIYWLHKHLLASHVISRVAASVWGTEVMWHKHKVTGYHWKFDT